FDLFILGDEPRHQEIQESLVRLFDEFLPGAYKLRVIDVRNHTEIVVENNVHATPTLIKCHPQPVQRVVGDLFVGECLLKELRIFPSEND
ncbi:MAG: hypothetical protein KDA84_25305, partial [Planctomycetaceae bacterium]|nr:hypothetical protein [Planctomycetaceae bacterium]